MKRFVKGFLFVAVLIFGASTGYAQTSKYKCMLQMIAYEGEAAYVVISLINPKGEYEKTLSVLGPDKKWYNTVKEWYKFEEKSKENLNGITGASIGGGDRTVKTIEIEDAKIDKGYTLRFESAVEEKKYHIIDVEIPLTTAGITEKKDGKGYLKFVKLSKVQ